jgi:hypothetical protein
MAMKCLRSGLTLLLLLLLLATPLAAVGDTRASTAPAALPAPAAPATGPQAALSEAPPPLPRLSVHLNGPQLFVKRDDQTGLATGGNKTRKLEFLLPT